MGTKYIYKNKNEKWVISNTKTGKSIKNFDTQKEAIEYAKSLKSTNAIIVKRKSGWKQLWMIGSSEEPDMKGKEIRTKDVKKSSIKKANDKVTIKKQSSFLKESNDSEKKGREEIFFKSKKVEKDKNGNKIITYSDGESNIEITKKSLPGWLQFLIGIIIISIVVAFSFLIGYYAL
ncbi:MAG: DUF2188 domain-containing protein [Mycoplasmatales bacterium]|nr:DUF2188 domain-containing protein [Mycoplasmatales bacterium]